MTIRSLMTTAAACAMLAAPALADINIGASLAETGPAAFLGDPEAKTLRMEVEKINAAGLCRQYTRLDGDGFATHLCCKNG